MKKIFLITLCVMLAFVFVACESESYKEQKAEVDAMTSEMDEHIEGTSEEPSSEASDETPVEETQKEDTEAKLTPIDIQVFGINVAFPSDSQVYDQIDENGSLSFKFSDTAILTIITMDAENASNEDLLSDPAGSEALKAGYENAYGDLEYQTDGTITIDGIDAIHFIYSYTRDGAPCTDEHVVFISNGMVIDMGFVNLDDSASNKELFDEIIRSIRFI